MDRQGAGGLFQMDKGNKRLEEGEPFQPRGWPAISDVDDAFRPTWIILVLPREELSRNPEDRSCARGHKLNLDRSLVDSRKNAPTEDMPLMGQGGG